MTKEERVGFEVCPFRVNTVTSTSMTIMGETYTTQDFAPCMREKCPAFKQDLILKIPIGEGGRKVIETCRMVDRGQNNALEYNPLG